MTRIQRTLPASQVQEIVADPLRGSVSLVGARGGLSLITGEIYRSNLIPHTVAFETEHGTIRHAVESTVTISEDDGRGLEGRSSGAMYAVQDFLTGHLSERYAWYATDKKRDDALARLTDLVASGIEVLLSSTEQKG